MSDDDNGEDEVNTQKKAPVKEGRKKKASKEAKKKKVAKKIAKKKSNKKKDGISKKSIKNLKQAVKNGKVKYDVKYDTTGLFSVNDFKFYRDLWVRKKMLKWIKRNVRHEIPS